MSRTRTLVGLALGLAAGGGALAVRAEWVRRDAEQARARAELRDEAAQVATAALRAERDAARAAEDRARIEVELLRRRLVETEENCRCLDAAAEEARRLRADAQRSLDLINRLMGVYDSGPGDEPRDRWTGVFLTGMEAALESGSVADALFFLERSRADVLLDHLRPADLAPRPPLPEALVRAERLARQREAEAMRVYERAWQGEDRDELKSARGAFLEARETRLLTALQTLRLMQALSGEAPVAPPGVDVLQALLSADEAYVAFAVLPERAVAVVVTRAAARLVPLGPTAEIQEAAAAASLNAGSPGAPPGPLEEALAALRRLLIEPLALPAAATTLILSPEEPLLAVPFCLLLGERDVCYAPSASVYRVLRASLPVRGQGVLAVGDPDRRSTGKRPLPPLPTTRDEARAIGSTVLVGSEATERRFKQELLAGRRWRAVHLGCHGDLVPENPLHDALILGGDGDEDGFLSALDVAGLTLPSDLVSLGSCETGLGPVPQGRGIGALTRAFLFAGASRVLGSQAKVDDEASKALLLRFYELWNPPEGSAPPSVAAALRRAQQHVRAQKRWAHPFYWAPWVLWGPP